MEIPLCGAMTSHTRDTLTRSGSRKGQVQSPTPAIDIPETPRSRRSSRGEITPLQTPRSTSRTNVEQQNPTPVPDFSEIPTMSTSVTIT